MRTVTYNGKTYTLITEAEPSGSLLDYPKNYHEVEIGEEFDFEMVAKAVDEEGNKYEVRWIFTDIKGEESDALDAYDYDDVYNVIEL